MTGIDYPFYQVVAEARRHAELGRIVFQKFTCEHCGSRQTIERANTFYATGECEECKKITNIEARGCNYMLFIDQRLSHDH